MTVPGRRMTPPAYLLALPVRFYRRWISRYTPPSCRYHPCCSSYALQALREHGAVKGVLLTGWRLLRCNPWSGGGVDHIPERGRWRWTPPAVSDDSADDGAAAPGAGPAQTSAAADRAAATTSRRFAA